MKVIHEGSSGSFSSHCVAQSPGAVVWVEKHSTSPHVGKLYPSGEQLCTVKEWEGLIQ